MSGKITLHTQQLSKNVIAVYIPVGKGMYRQASGAVAAQHEISLAHLEAGVYVLFLETGKQQFVQRIVIVK